MKLALIWGVPLVLLMALAVLLFFISNMEFAKLRSYADSIASDGTAESFTKRVHLAMTERAQWLSGLLATLAVLLALFKKRILYFLANLKQERQELKADKKKGIAKIKKYTSKEHKRAVFAILAIGAGLRIFFLFEPITYDEAFTYVHYISKPLTVLLSDYSYPNNHIFHNLLAKVFTSVLGAGEVPLRLTALLFGLLFMPLAYVFTRVMFNRYIAITTLALVASAGGFVEYSALARGYSITWVCFALGLLLGRYFLKKNSLYIMFLLGVVNAVGLWAVPTMIYPALSIYAWLFIRVAFKYNRSLNERLYKIFASIGVMLVTATLLYLPVILTYGLGQLFSHPTMGDSSWAHFMEHDQEQLYEVWKYTNETSQLWITLTLIVASIFSLVISSKYRVLAFGAALAIIPMVLVQSIIGPPRVWNFGLLYLCISGGIGIFYLLKFVQDKAIAGFGKRTRTIASSALIILGCGYLSFAQIPDRIYRMHEADGLGSYFNSVLDPEDRVFVTFPIEAQIEYQFMKRNIDLKYLYQEPVANSMVYVLVNEKRGQTVNEVMDAVSGPEYFEETVLVEEKENTSIYKTKLK